MSAYRDSARPVCESHTWAEYWRKPGPGGASALIQQRQVMDVACSTCGERARGWRWTAWLLGVWVPAARIIGRPPEPPPW